MELQKLKEAINKVGFAEDALVQMNTILDAAITRGSLEEEEKQKLLAIVDFEIENENIQADMLEDMADALETYANEHESAEKLYADELDIIEKDVDEFIGEDKKTEPQVTKPEEVKTEPAPVVQTPQPVVVENTPMKQEDLSEISKIRESLQQAATAPINEPTPPPFPSTPTPQT